ncbi:MAG: hypothetical protein EOM55_00270 [Clostridia bacterium]|nr:hypothetical protein [Clostridia bacterium]
MENLLLIQKTLMGQVLTNENIIFDNVVLNEGSMSYNTSSGIITLSEAGNYHISWWVANQSVSAGLDVSFSLISGSGANIISNSPSKTSSFSGIGIVQVTSPTTLRLVNSSAGTAYLCSNTSVKATLMISMVKEDAPTSTMYNFQILQLTNVLSQIITLYPDNILSIFVRGLYYMEGTPTALYSSSSGVGLFISTDEGAIQAVPLNMITGIYAGDGSTYDESMTFLSPLEPFPAGWSTDVITSVHDYLPEGTAVDDVVFSIGNSRSGFIYKSPYGMIVVTEDMAGTNPTFIPATEASIIITETPSAKKSSNLKKTEI